MHGFLFHGKKIIASPGQLPVTAFPRVQGRAPAALKLTGERAPHARHPSRYRYMRQWLNRQRSNRLVNPIQKKIPGSTEGPSWTGCNATLDRGKKWATDASTAPFRFGRFRRVDPRATSDARLTVDAATLAATESLVCLLS